MPDGEGRGSSFCKHCGNRGCWSAFWGDVPHAQAKRGESHELVGFLTHSFIAALKYSCVVFQTARLQHCSTGLAMETRPQATATTLPAGTIPDTACLLEQDDRPAPLPAPRTGARDRREQQVVTGPSVRVEGQG